VGAPNCISSSDKQLDSEVNVVESAALGIAGPTYSKADGLPARALSRIRKAVGSAKLDNIFNPPVRSRRVFILV
jgi:hypothetical protein